MLALVRVLVIDQARAWAQRLRPDFRPTVNKPLAGGSTSLNKYNLDLGFSFEIQVFKRVKLGLEAGLRVIFTG